MVAILTRKEGMCFEKKSKKKAIIRLDDGFGGCVLYDCIAIYVNESSGKWNDSV